MSSPFSIVSHDFPSLPFLVSSNIASYTWRKDLPCCEIPFQYVLNKIHRSRAIRKSPWSQSAEAFVVPFVCSFFHYQVHDLGYSVVVQTRAPCLLFI
jgi:hypothetical protein